MPVYTRLGRKVASKISREEFSGHFEREARAISALNHPNVCTLYDVGPNYLVTELVEGETLRDLLKRALPLARRLQIAKQVLEALWAAHHTGIVHRREAARHHGPFRWLCEGVGFRHCEADASRYAPKRLHCNDGCKFSRPAFRDSSLHVA
jgi:hypothetical protein